MSYGDIRDYSKSINNTVNTNDVSFSIPEWKNQEIKSINQDYEKQIYRDVLLSLTDFDSKEEIEFMTKPEKSTDEKYAYERKLIHSEDFSILAFIICFEQTLIGDPETKPLRLETFKKRVNDLDLCELKNVPSRVQSEYNNKFLKKILFQYINKGSYNVSLLEILLRRNYVLKFALSLVSKAILAQRMLIVQYKDEVSPYIEMRVCGDYFDVLQNIKVRDKSIETTNFLIDTSMPNITVLRKQNIIKTKIDSDPKKMKRMLSPQQSSRLRNKSPARELKKAGSQNRDYGKSRKSVKSIAEGSRSSKSSHKRSNSLFGMLKKFICF